MIKEAIIGKFKIILLFQSYMYRNIKDHPILIKKFPPHLLWILVLAIGLSSCQSFKGTKIYYFWHNMNARFNGYFNAKEKMLDMENDLFDNKVDNFNRIIDVFTVTDDKTKDAYMTIIESITKKCGTVITKHGTSKWIKNCYFVIGKAEFYKRDFFTAIETFEYVAEKYPDDAVGQESKVWLIRCQMEEGKMNNALSMIAANDSDKNFPIAQKGFLQLVEADYFIRNGEYKSAIKKMELALPTIKVRKYATRYMFILAQLYQATEKNEEAAKYYTMVIKRHPGYDLSFQAKLMLAQVSTDEDQVEKYLTKLLKDERNIDYKDQIYYTLAKVELKKGNKNKAIEYLQLSTKASKKNNNQKALSFKTEAEIYFGMPVYPLAKMYYDSAAKFITPDFPDYTSFKARQTVLSDLISNLIIVHDEDSLLNISKYDTARLSRMIDSTIESKRLLAIQQKNALNNPLPGAPVLNLPSTDNGGLFGGRESYFYNSTALSQGNSEFVSRWGNRPLADDWRRKNKTATNSTEESASNNPDSSGTKSQNENDNTVSKPGSKKMSAEKQKYFQQIPFTPSQKNIANNKIEEAMYSIGNIYYNSLGERKKAEEIFEDLLKRYPNGSYVVQTHYNLYKVYKDDSNKVKSDYHKNIVLTDFPGTVYAQLIVNPDQLRQQFLKSKKNEELENAYSIAFQHFNANDCNALDNDVQQANVRFSKNYLKPKFEYLALVCKGKKDSINNFIGSLRGFLTKYPGEEISKQVQDEILYLEGIQRKRKTETLAKDSAKAKSMVLGGGDKVKVDYQKTPNQPHQFVMIIPAVNDLNAVKKALGDYDNENYQSQQLKINSFSFCTDRQIILIQNYKDYNQALQYYKDLEKSPDFYKKLNLKFHEEFIISDTNFGLFNKHQDVEGYLKFFKENYLD